MTRMRFDTRRTPVARTWVKLHLGMIDTIPEWYNAYRAFPPPSPFPNEDHTTGKGKRRVREITYLEDDLLKSFHQKYLEIFKEPYVGISHQAETRHSGKYNRRTYRNAFVIEWANALRRNPYISRDEAFQMTLKALEPLRKRERNKNAAFTRFLMDPQSQHLNKDLASMKPDAEGQAMARAIRNLRKKVAEDRKYFKSMIDDSKFMFPQLRSIGKTTDNRIVRKHFGAGYIERAE